MKRSCLLQGLGVLALIVLVGCGFNPQTPNLDEDDGTIDEQLVQAITAEDAAEVEELLSAGANPNALDSDGNALLPLAAKSGHLEIVQSILDNGADVNSTMSPSGSGRTALMEAVRNNRGQVVDVLIAGGADVDLPESDSGFTALHYAAAFKSTDIVNTLIENGADPNLQANDGYTPLHNAVRIGSPEVIEALLDGGAEVDVPDNEGRTPMMELVRKGRGSAIESLLPLLLEAGADPNRQDNSGNTALHHAVLVGMIDAIPILIEYGASVEVKNNDDQTPEDVALYATTAEALRKASTSGPPTAVPTVAADGIWTKRADMPTGRWELSTCVVDGKIYAIGGAGPVWQALGSMEEYDPTTDTWTTKSEMPTARQGLSTSVVDGKIYAIGGGAASSSSYNSVETYSTVEEYDPAPDIWTTKSPMPTARGFHSANVVDGKIYVIGGSHGDPSWNHVRTVEVYDPATDTWTQKGDMPRGVGAGYSSVVGGKIYVFGGYGGSGRVDQYDPVTDTWTQESDMPTSRHALTTSALDGKIYAIGGYVPGVSGYPGVATVEVYDPATDTWTTAPDMPTGRFGPRSSVVDEKIYVIGGMEYWIGSAYGTVEEYDPQ